MIENHISSSYFIVTFLLSGLLLIPQAVFPIAGNYSLVFPQLSPAIAVLLIVIITKNRELLKNIGSKLFFSKGLLKWFFAILSLIIISVLGTSFYLSYKGFQFKPWQGTLKNYFVNTLFLFIGAVFEEIGWRGFWLSELSKNHSLFKSSIIIGVLWGIWHMNFGLGIFGYIAFILFTTISSVIMSLIFRLSENSLILMIVWHFFVNLSFGIFLRERVLAECFIGMDLIFGVICIVMVFWKSKLLFAVPMKDTYRSI